MEESKYTAYDLESTEATENPENAENTENSEPSENSKTSENNDPETNDNDDNTEKTGDADKARDELARMVDEMGADTLLEIIRDNRNAAIRQIINEVEATQTQTIPSGTARTFGCSSIFDLAAQA